MRGIDLEGNEGIVSISRERRMQLALSTLRYIHRKWSGRYFSSLIGLSSAIFQLRRHGYAILGECIEVIGSRNIQATKYVPIAAKMKVIKVAVLAP